MSISQVPCNLSTDFKQTSMSHFFCLLSPRLTAFTTQRQTWQNEKGTNMLFLLNYSRLTFIHKTVITYINICCWCCEVEQRSQPLASHQSLFLWNSSCAIAVIGWRLQPSHGKNWWLGSLIWHRGCLCVWQKYCVVLFHHQVQSGSSPYEITGSGTLTHGLLYHIADMCYMETVWLMIYTSATGASSQPVWPAYMIICVLHRCTQVFHIGRYLLFASNHGHITERVILPWFSLHTGPELPVCPTAEWQNRCVTSFCCCNESTIQDIHSVVQKESRVEIRMRWAVL